MTRFTVRSRPGFTLSDLLVVVGLIPLVGVMVLSCRGRTSDVSNYVTCASNLRQISQAILLYANDNRGAFPRTVFAGGEEVAPVFGTGANAKNPFEAGGPAANDVTAAWFLLLRTQDITAEVFTCPSSNAEKWDFGGGTKTALDWSNWPKELYLKYLSYSFANPYPDDAAAKSGYKLNTTLSPEFAVAADLNPGVVKGTSDVTAVSSTSSNRDMKQANSQNHAGNGQNVLYGDGHVEFQQNPFVGINRDNIYVRRAASTGYAPAPLPLARSPYDANDSVLLPYAE